MKTQLLPDEVQGPVRQTPRGGAADLNRWAEKHCRWEPRGDKGAKPGAPAKSGAGTPELTDAERRIAERLRGHVDRLAGHIGPRHVGRPAAMEAAAAYIESELTALGDSVERQAYCAAGVEVANLVVERRGAERPDETVVLGAHYDTLAETPGADDNASAVATLIEVARLLQGRSFSRTIRFAAFACEEPPHFYTDEMGSRQHAARCRARGENVVGMLCLEMVGYYSSAPGSQRPPPEAPGVLHWAFPDRGDFLAAVGNLRSCGLLWRFRGGFRRATRLPLFSMALPEAFNSIRLSDNSSFWDQGYPALMITDTSFLRNPNYHQPGDTPDTLDYARMARATIGVAGGVAGVAARRAGIEVEGRGALGSPAARHRP